MKITEASFLVGDGFFVLFGGGVLVFVFDPLPKYHLTWYCGFQLAEMWEYWVLFSCLPCTFYFGLSLLCYNLMFLKYIAQAIFYDWLLFTLPPFLTSFGFSESLKRVKFSQLARREWMSWFFLLYILQTVKITYSFHTVCLITHFYTL